MNKTITVTRMKTMFCRKNIITRNIKIANKKFLKHLASGLNYRSKNVFHENVL